MHFDKTIIIAPHCDDVIFSIGASLSHGLLGLASVVVVFSHTDYTVGGRGNAAAVTARRKREELDALKGLVQTVVFLDFDDWVLGTRQQINLTTHQQQKLTNCLSSLNAPESNLLFPLGLGAHPDHLALRYFGASLEMYYSISFYEDMPYRCYISTVEVGLRGCWKVLGPVAGQAKQRLMHIYRSQLASSDLHAIMDHMANTGGEKIFMLPSGTRE